MITILTTYYSSIYRLTMIKLLILTFLFNICNNNNNNENKFLQCDFVIMECLLISSITSTSF